MSGQGSGGNVLAAICSFFIPGLGQLVQGRILAAIIFRTIRCFAPKTNAAILHRNGVIIHQIQTQSDEYSIQTNGMAQHTQCGANLMRNSALNVVVGTAELAQSHRLYHADQWGVVWCGGFKWALQARDNLLPNLMQTTSRRVDSVFIQSQQRSY